jgi:signal transduction histidine kinase
MIIQNKKRANPELIINSFLADVMINNLLQNAIRYNLDKGQISIELETNSLTISNSYPAPTIFEPEMFARFSKSNASKDSLGLELSIVKRMTGLYGMDLRNSFSDGLHHFKLTF